MTLYTTTLANVTVLTTASSSPGTGWSSVSNVQAAFNQARTNKTPLFIQPGTYTTTEIDINSSTGSGNFLTAYAIPRTVTLQFTGGNTLFYVNDIDVSIDGLTFDGNYVAFNNASETSALLTVSGTGNITVNNCMFTQSATAGIFVESATTGSISKCTITACSDAIWTQDSQMLIEDNIINNCTNGGIRVYNSTKGSNLSSVTNNYIATIGTLSGTGANGNGIFCYQAENVTISNNRIYNCQYAAIRCNTGADITVSGNYCYQLRETGIFIECPTSNTQLYGVTVTGNIVDQAGSGIRVVNSGGARRASVTGNVISNIVIATINDPGYVPTTGVGAGIMVEDSVVVSGNTVDTAAGFGIIAGTNTACENLNINGNTVLNSNIGIGFSTYTGAGQILISSNMVQGASGGSIVPTIFNGASYQYQRVSGSSDYGNQYDAQIGNAFLGNNRSY